jgi:hypothetical protein
VKNLFFTSLLVYGVLAVVITFYFGLQDLRNAEAFKHDLLANVRMAIGYYVTWVLPYWWSLILLVSVILTILTVALGALSRRFRQSNDQ